MKSEFDIFQEDEKPPKFFVEAVEGWAQFLRKAFENGVLPRLHMYVVVNGGSTYLHIDGDGYPAIGESEIVAWAQGNHSQNLNTVVDGEEGVVMPIKIGDKLVQHFIKTKSFGCNTINVYLNLFFRFADEFQMYYTPDPNQEGRVYITVFAKLKDVWFTNIYKQWGSYLNP